MVARIRIRKIRIKAILVFFIGPYKHLNISVAWFGVYVKIFVYYNVLYI